MLIPEIVKKCFRKCYVCRRRWDLVPVMGKVTKYGEYGGEYQVDGFYYFHEDCVHEVMNHPKKYSHNTVDRAIHIVELLEDEQRKYERECEKQAEEEKDFKVRVEEAQKKYLEIV